MEKTVKTESPKAPDIGQLKAEDTVLSVLEIDESGVRIKLWPDVSAVRDRLNQLRPKLQQPYSTRHYVCGRAMYCAIALDEATRDAPCPAGYRVGRDVNQREADGSFLAAAAAWGIGTGVFELPVMTISSDKVHIVPRGKPGTNLIDHYELDDALTVTGISYSEDGSIDRIGIRKRDGGVITWQPKN